jgi:glycine/D-amino acid oxidase-like deaminating enzyme
LLSGVRDGKLQVPRQSESEVKNFLENVSMLDGAKVSIYGAGTFGLAVANCLSCLGAKVTITSDPAAPVAMSRAVGILEPQGAEVQDYWIQSVPQFDMLMGLGAPLRWDTVKYLYPTGVPLDESFLAQIRQTPGGMPETRTDDYKVTGYTQSLQFRGIIMPGVAYREWLVNQLIERGVTFKEGHVSALFPDAESDITVYALGLGRGAKSGFSDVRIDGNRGQMIVVDGEYLPQGSLGIPSREGSVNIVQHYVDPAKKQGAYVVIGATKEPGSSVDVPRQEDWEFMLSGVEKLCPELFEILNKEPNFGSGEPQAVTWVCVRPGTGSPFKVTETNGCFDIQAAGGMGNSLAPAVALEIACRAVNKLLSNQKLSCLFGETSRT